MLHRGHECTGQGTRLEYYPRGLLEITGRVGSMIKLRGYSVVPAKVETAIVQHLAVRQCTVVAHGEALERQLVAYIVRDKEVSADRPNLEVDEVGHSPASRKTLSPYLAHYMIPALWVEVEELPTHSVSGKVDLKRLPPPPKPKAVNGNDVQLNGSTKGDQDPITTEAIAEIWAASLKISRSTIQPEPQLFRSWWSFLDACRLVCENFKGSWCQNSTRSLGRSSDPQRSLADDTLCERRSYSGRASKFARRPPQRFYPRRQHKAF